MLRSSFLVFIAGWLVWFWIDKPGPRQFRMPPVSDSMLENFQAAFAMLKAGYVDMSFVFLWKAHYLVLSLLLGALLAIAYHSLAEQLGRRRMRRHFLPPSRPPSAPADDAVSTEVGNTQERDRSER